MLKGKPEFFNNLDFSKISDKEFVEKIYDSLLARKYSKEEFEEKIKRLEDQTISKEDMYNEILDSRVYVNLKPFSIYDLDDDPFEENPIIVSHDITTLIEYQKYLQKMIELEISDDYFTDSPQNLSKKDAKVEALLRDELEKLGYL